MHLTQAQRAIQVGLQYEPDGLLFPFSRYRLLDMLAHVDDQQTLYSFRYPPLMALIEDDAKHGTSFTYTLFIHLQSPSHVSETCKRLFIHKNTLYYRLNRIHEIMGVDIKDGRVIAQIELTFLILKHQGKFEELVISHSREARAISQTNDPTA